MIKNVLISGAILFFSSFVYADEQITITTYYPSPYGSYNSLQTYKLGVGDNNGDNNLTSADVPINNGDVWISGKVGIGTGTPVPGAKLHVLSTGDVAHELFDTTATTNKRVRINFAQNGVQNMEIGTDYYLGNTTDLYIYNRATGQTAAYFNPAGDVWFAPTGNVGIGTTNPGAKLEVNGNIKIDAGGFSGRAACWKADNTLGWCVIDVGTGTCIQCN